MNGPYLNVGPDHAGTVGRLLIDAAAAAVKELSGFSAFAGSLSLRTTATVPCTRKAEQSALSKTATLSCMVSNDL